jgi:molecular chaperone HscB
MDYFALFGVPATFDQDASLIKARYYQLQQKVHPDNFVNEQLPEKRSAIMQSSTINDAYQTLKEPYRRAIYILKLRGVDVLSETSVTLPPAFLMEQMEYREQIAELKDSPQLLMPLKVAIEKALADNEKALTGLDGGQLSLEQAKMVLWKMQFYLKLREEIAEIENPL